jgi:hypothetical protein
MISHQPVVFSIHACGNAVMVRECFGDEGGFHPHSTYTVFYEFIEVRCIVPDQVIRPETIKRNKQDIGILLALST